MKLKSNKQTKKQDKEDTRMGLMLPLNPLPEESPLIERGKKGRIMLNKKKISKS